MTDCKLKQDIKKIIVEGCLTQLHERDIDLTVEKLHTLFDIEKVRALEATRQDFTEVRIKVKGLRSDY